MCLQLETRRLYLRHLYKVCVCVSCMMSSFFRVVVSLRQCRTFDKALASAVKQKKKELLVMWKISVALRARDGNQLMS